MSNQNILMPNYTIGSNIYEKIEEICPKYGTTAVIIGGRKAIEAAEKKLLDAAKTIKIIDTLWYGGEACVQNVKALKNHKTVKDCDMIFALGGGKAIDTAKCVAEIAEKPVFTFPTLASTNSCCTRASILYRPDGTYAETFVSVKPPVHAFIDTSVIAAAPAKYLEAGIANTLACWYSVNSEKRNQLSESLKEFYSEEHGTPADFIIQTGAFAVQDNMNNFVTSGFEQVVFTNTVTSALFTDYDDTDEMRQLADFIITSLVSIENIQKNHLYGEVAALGLLVLLLYNGQNDEFERIFEAFKSMNFPVSFDDIELTRYQLDMIFESDKYDISEALDELEQRNQFV